MTYPQTYPKELSFKAMTRDFIRLYGHVLVSTYASTFRMKTNDKFPSSWTLFAEELVHVHGKRVW